MFDNGKSLVSRVARQLAELSMDSEDGCYIGGEDELLQRLGVSRPTLRQAAKIAETERMISVRRGVRGGFYAARPDVADAIRTINRYLRLQGAQLKDLRIVESVPQEAARLAAACTDEAQRAQLAALVAEAVTDTGTAKATMQYDARFMAHIAAMSGNPAAELIMGMTYAFGWEEQGIFLYTEQAQRDQMRALFIAIGEAILAGDGDLARFQMQRRLQLVHGWIAAAEPSQLGPTGEFLST